MVVQNYWVVLNYQELSWPFTVLMERRPISGPGLVAQLFTVFTLGSCQSLGFSGNLHCFSKQEINRTSSWCWSVL